MKKEIGINLIGLVGGYVYLSNEELAERLFNMVRDGGVHVFGAKTLTEFLAMHTCDIDRLEVVLVKGATTGVGISCKSGPLREEQESSFLITNAILADLGLALTTEEKTVLVDLVRRQLVETLNDLMRVRDYEHLLEALNTDNVKLVSSSGRSIPISAGDPTILSLLTSCKNELNSRLDKVLPSILALNKLLPEKEETDN